MRVLVGISGSIGVLGIHTYLLRLAAEPGLTLGVVMTPTAARIVAPGALGAVLGCSIVTDPWQGDHALSPSVLVAAVDVFIVAPASATTLAFCATGAAANPVAACYLAHPGASIFAPVMAPEMLLHPAVQRNLHHLSQDGAIVLPTGEGLRASDGSWSRQGALCDYATLRQAVLRAAATMTPRYGGKVEAETRHGFG